MSARDWWYASVCARLCPHPRGRGADPFEQHGRGLVSGILRHKLELWAERVLTAKSLASVFAD